MYDSPPNLFPTRDSLFMDAPLLMNALDINDQSVPGPSHHVLPPSYAPAAYHAAHYDFPILHPPSSRPSLYQHTDPSIQYSISTNNPWSSILSDFDTQCTNPPIQGTPISYDSIPPALSHSTNSSPSDINSIPDFDSYGYSLPSAVNPHDPIINSPYDDHPDSFSPINTQLSFPDEQDNVSDVPPVEPVAAQRRKPSVSENDKSAKHDPLAADFIRAQLGEAKWLIFSSRLAEQRASKHKLKQSASAARAAQEDDHTDAPPATAAAAASNTKSSPGASVLDFLVKVEVVKSVLRTYVPHPYNPLKSLAHPYPLSPTGTVVLMRSTVLALCGWSNTQFSYWARRAEAISVLAPHDRRLRAVACALERQLRAAGVVVPLQQSADGEASTGSEQGLEEEWLDMYVTGKGLDSIIEEVKRRTGASPFLRGRHSSLDPFSHVEGDRGMAGAASGSGSAAAGRKAVEGLAVYVPTFQADYHGQGQRQENEQQEDTSTPHSEKRKAQPLELEGSADALQLPPFHVQPQPPPQARPRTQSHSHTLGRVPTNTDGGAEQSYLAFPEDPRRVSFELSDSRAQSPGDGTMGQAGVRAHRRSIAVPRSLGGEGVPGQEQQPPRKKRRSM